MVRIASLTDCVVLYHIIITNLYQAKIYWEMPSNQSYSSVRVIKREYRTAVVVSLLTLNTEWRSTPVKHPLMESWLVWYYTDIGKLLVLLYWLNTNGNYVQTKTDRHLEAMMHLAIQEKHLYINKTNRNENGLPNTCQDVSYITFIWRYI